MKKPIDRFAAIIISLSLSIPLSVFCLLSTLHAETGSEEQDGRKGNPQAGVEFAPKMPMMPAAGMAPSSGKDLEAQAEAIKAAQKRVADKKAVENRRGMLAPMWSAMTGSDAPAKAPARRAPSAPSNAQVDWSKVPQANGIYLADPMQKEMWQAAQGQDFERAIELRDQLNGMRQNLSWWNEQEKLEARMQQAVSELNFEQAIEIREEMRVLQAERISADPSRSAAQADEPAVPQGPFFSVQGFNVHGNELVSKEEILTHFSPLVGKEISLQDIQAAASAVKQLYRTRGYVGAYVSIPPQTLDDGIVDIEVTEGKIGQIKIRGNQHFSTDVLRRQMNLPAGGPLTYQQVENRLLKLDDHRDIDVKATFVPGEQPGTTDLDLEVTDRLPLHGALDFNNYGTRLAGEERYGLSFTHTNLLGQMDELYTRFQFSEGGTAYAADYSVPAAFINPDMRIGGSYVLGELDLQGDFKALNIEGETQTWGLYTTMPLYDTVNNDVNLKVGMDFKSVQNEILSTRIGDDQLRIVNTIVTWEEKDRLGRTIWPHGLHLGVDAFGASNKNDIGLSRAHTGAPFLIYRSQVQRIQYLTEEVAVRAKGAWQLTPDKLPPSEQFSIGGHDSVRGYPQGEYLGDYGAVAGAEISVPVFFLPRDWRLPFQKESLYKNLRAITFYDYGTGNLRGALPGESSKKDISGTGFGVRLRLNDTLAAQVGYGIPLTETASDGNDGVVYFGVSADLF
jgi:hemolysin activation/secretion protein